MIEIKSRFDGRVLYTAETAQDVRAAVTQAVAAKTGLRGAYLDGADLDGANLDGANLYGAYLGGANLYGANLDGANLDGADLSRANLRGANLGGANLGGANLYWANLYGANLRGAGILHVEGLPSGTATLIPEPDGWALQIGCWRGTITELREMIACDDGWPEAVGAQIAERRPMLAALADMADAWAAANPLRLEHVQEIHGATVFAE